MGFNSGFKGLITSFGIEEQLLVRPARNFVIMLSEIRRKFVDK